MHDFTRPFNLDRFRIPFSLPSPLYTLLSSAFLSFIFFLFFFWSSRFILAFDLEDTWTSKNCVGRKWKIRDRFRLGLRRKRVISVCPWNSFPIGKLASILVISSNQHFSIVLALRPTSVRKNKDANVSLILILTRNKIYLENSLSSPK